VAGGWHAGIMRAPLGIYTWQFLVAAGLGLLGGIALSYELRSRIRGWAMGALAALLAFVLEFAYRQLIFSRGEPTKYDGSFLQFEELGLSFIIFLCVGIVIEIVLRSSIGSLLKALGK